MDLSLINAAAASLGLARDFSKAALAVRDFNEMAAIVSKLYDQILDAQDKLFTLTRELLREQQENLGATQKILELEQTLDDRREYHLVDLGDGVRAYQRKAPAVTDTEVVPTAHDTIHYLCQLCFESRGLKVTLQPYFYFGSRFGLECLSCKGRFITRDQRSNYNEFARLGASMNGLR
jgi:hypothetical protein